MTPKLPPLTDVLNLLPDAVCLVDVDGRYLFVSESFERIFGYAPGEVIGLRAFDLVHPDDRAATMQQAERVMDGEFQRHFRNRYLHKDGHAVDILWSARWLPEYGVRIGVAREISELRRAERELEHRAAHDLLTGLPNRLLLERRLREHMQRAAQSGGGLAVLYLDLDGFKAANDRCGHGAGDQVLREVAQRLQQSLRHGDLVARIGGDEFVVLLPGCSDAADAGAIADTLRARLQPPYTLPDGPLQLDASVGIACYPGDGRDLDTLLANADRAMYADKRQAARRRA
ncbi:diguanylate cyclase domain-containing protein [Lysobacter yangpyeongensis]|uniref:Diguanylate cyclase domain-containing protein n=1 Tax=Lysobacter yangpyeongensis TaxID=346182 RepID=A0ABW0SI42_9GAMM